MSPRPRPAFALALATAIAGAGTSTASLPVGADEPEEPIEYCYTEALTLEEVEAGVQSVVDCYDEPLAQRFSINLAVIYDGTGLGGSNTTVTGSSCNGAFVVFGAGHPWDNRVGSTDLLACGYAKHYQHSNFTGNNQLMTNGGATDMSPLMNNQTSSIEYAP